LVWCRRLVTEANALWDEPARDEVALRLVPDGLAIGSQMVLFEIALN
jgi:hypothetical protein